MSRSVFDPRIAKHRQALRRAIERHDGNPANWIDGRVPPRITRVLRMLDVLDELLEERTRMSALLDDLLAERLRSRSRQAGR